MSDETIANLEAEQTLLGGLLLDGSAFDRISDRLKPEHFTTELHRELYAEIARQLGAGKSCDVLTVSEAMGERTSFAELMGLRSTRPAPATWSATPKSCSSGPRAGSSCG